jgi:arylsulfatase A-like enzyme
VSTQAKNKKTQQPNILFIFSDDLSYRDLSCYGQKHYQTPNLDKLAMNGMRFTQAYSGSSECAPARASLMTGMHMGHCRIRKNRSVRMQDHLLTEDITVAEVLKQAGYTTGFIGKWGIGLPGTEGTPDKQGFDFSYGYYDQLRAHGFFPHYMMKNGKAEAIPENYGFDMERMYRHNRDKTGKYGNTYDDNGRLIPDGVKDPSKAKYSEDLFQKEAVTFIKENKDKPFFLYYATQLPHGPCIAPDIGKFKDKPWDQKHKEWAAMVERMDSSVGKMVETLEQTGVLNNTIIFFAGDNGYSQHGYFGRKVFQDDPLFKNKGPWPKGKSTCTHEGGVRVPFFAYWKGKIKTQENDHICALYDILATSADLAGTTPPKTDGISLAPTLLSKPDQQKHIYLYWENGSRSRHAQSVRMDKWWAFRDNPSKPIELYDITKDIDCERNLAKDNPNIVAKIEQIFKEAHVDSKWYINPGESKAQIDAKTQKAQDSGQMQTPVKANTIYKGKK